MATDTDNDGNSIYSTPKGGLYGGPLDLAGLDPNVQATLMGYRWTPSFGGSDPPPPPPTPLSVSDERRQLPGRRQLPVAPRAQHLRAGDDVPEGRGANGPEP